MTPEQFVYWLQGFIELDSAKSSPDERQWKIIQDHLKEVFIKKTPDRVEHSLPRLPVEPDNDPFFNGRKIIC